MSTYFNFTKNKWDKWRIQEEEKAIAPQMLFIKYKFDLNYLNKNRFLSINKQLFNNL